MWLDERDFLGFFEVLQDVVGFSRIFLRFSSIFLEASRKKQDDITREEVFFGQLVGPNNRRSA